MTVRVVHAVLVLAVAKVRKRLCDGMAVAGLARRPVPYHAH